MEVKIDLKDKKILYELDRDSRQTNKQIARKVRLSEQVVGKRIKRLIDEKVIEYFFVKTNPGLLGYMHIKIYIRLHNMTKQKEEELIEKLKKQDSIYWLSSLRGKYDIVASIYVKNIADFTRKYEAIFGEWGNYILERNIIILEKAFTYTKAYLLPEHEPEEILYSGETRDQHLELDRTDTELLKILNREGRKPLIEIAPKLKVSTDTISYRIKNLKKKEIITGFGVKIDFNKLGNSYYIISLKLQNMNKERYRKLETLSKFNKNIIIYIMTIGDHDLELEVETTKKEELDELIKELKNNFTTEIKNYEILEVTREHRMTYFPFNS